MLQAARGQLCQLCGVVISSIIWRSIGEFDLWAGEIRWGLQLSMIQFDSIGIWVKFNPLIIWLPVVEVCEEAGLVKSENSILMIPSIVNNWFFFPALFEWHSPHWKVEGINHLNLKSEVFYQVVVRRDEQPIHDRMPSQWGSSLQLLMPLKSFDLVGWWLVVVVVMWPNWVQVCF